MHTDILQLSHVHVCQPPCLAHTYKTNLPYRSTFKTHFPLTPNHHNLNFSTPTYITKPSQLHFTLHAQLCLLLTAGYCTSFLPPCSSVPFLSVGPCLHLALCLSPLLTTPFIHTLCMAFLLQLKFVFLLLAHHLEVQDKMAYHLHMILCTSDAVTASTPVTLFFPLGVWLCLKKKK